MEENLKNHKKKFSDKKLIDIIPDSWGYYVSKVYEGIYSNHPLAEMHFRLILDVYENLKKGIVERYESISVLIGVQDEVRKIDYIANRLKEWISNGELAGNNDAEVFLDCFVDRFSDLKKMLIEIDNEFDTK